MKSIGAKYIILGHSEKRSEGDTDQIINKKILIANKEKLKIILCVGETYKEKKNKVVLNVLKKQLNSSLKNLKKFNNIILAYEPIWSIGTGRIPLNSEITKNVNFIKIILKKKYKIQNIKVLYGGSVNQNNINILKKINNIDGFLIGGASQNYNKLIDIVKKTII